MPDRIIKFGSFLKEFIKDKAGAFISGLAIGITLAYIMYLDKQETKEEKHGLELKYEKERDFFVSVVNDLKSENKELQNRLNAERDSCAIRTKQTLDLFNDRYDEEDRRIRALKKEESRILNQVKNSTNKLEEKIQ